MLHLWWWTKAKLAIVLVQAASLEVKLAIVFTDFLVQASCVLHPWWRTKAKLAIVGSGVYKLTIVITDFCQAQFQLARAVAIELS